MKLRAGLRQNWWSTSLTPQITVPGRFDAEGQPLLAGVTSNRNDAPFDWNIGVLYKATPNISPSTYDFAIAGVHGFKVGVEINYRGKTFSNITNVNHAPGFVVANALFGYARFGWGVDLNVRNITDQRYFIAANGAGAFVGEPLSAFVTAHFSY